MEKGFIRVAVMAIAVLIAGAGTSIGETCTPTPISAEQAFDAVQAQQDPTTGAAKTVFLVDVRSRAEYYWVGGPCQVDSIILENDDKIIPDDGKVKLIQEGKFLEFEVYGKYKRIQTGKIKSAELSPIATNIPYQDWDDKSAKLVPNGLFDDQIAALIDNHPDSVLIFFCRSGGRSQDCLVKLEDLGLPCGSLYEIDQPSGADGYGGFEGGTYGNLFNGYRGFPGRRTDGQAAPSVSWKDTGLPMKTGMKPANVIPLPAL